VAESIPQAPPSVSDKLHDVGSSISSFFGEEDDSVHAGENRVNKVADAVLNFTYVVSEIGYDQLTATALRRPDQTIRLFDIAMTAPEEHLTGSGEITYVKGLPLSARPLSLDLQFGARKAVRRLLSAGGLLSSQKDDLGYTLLKQAIHFGGTVEQIDASAWHDLLAKAAASPPPDARKKGG
jgi:hypothetical protein